LDASLAVLTVPSAARVPGERLKSFAATLGRAGLRLAPPVGEAGALIN
jgi:hypothetical protein